MLSKFFRFRRDHQIPARLRRLGLPLNSAAGSADLVSLCAAVGADLPDELQLLYRDHNGQKPVPYWDYRLMSTQEAIETAGFNNTRSMAHVLHLHLFWTNDNSDYLALGLAEPLQGMVCISEHDGEPLCPAYRSLESLYRDLFAAYRRSKKNDTDGEEVEEIRIPVGLPRDELRKHIAKAFGMDKERDEQYFPPSPRSEPPECLRHFPGDFHHGTSDPNLVEQDRMRARELGKLFGSAVAYDRALITNCLVQLTPRSDSEQLIPLLDDNDFYVAAAVAESLGIRKTEAAFQRLVQLARTGVSNARTSAWDALCNFPCDETLHMAVNAFGDPAYLRWSPHAFLNLLVANGCEVRFRRTSEGWKNLRYRLPNSIEWHNIS